MTMRVTLQAGCDRAGHGARRAAAAAILVLTLFPSVSAAADYVARRFDVAAAITDAGGLEVVETVVFEFQSGTFQHVWRDIPVARTDGIEILEARMDGVAFPRGEGAGRIEVSGRRRIRVEWRFAPIGPSVHTFELRYLARGVVYREGGQDVVRWRLLPTEHRYTIAESRSVIRTPGAPARPARLETRRVAAASSSSRPDGVEIVASAIRSNGWVIADLRFARGSIAASTPQWQQRDAYARALAPEWMIGAAGVFAAAILVLVMMRQSYPSPTVPAGDATATSPPEPLPAAVASVLAAKGGFSGYQSAPTLLDLADRGVLGVRELPRAFGVRHYEIAKVRDAHALADHEAEAIRIAFGGREEPVSLSKARARLGRASRRFNAALDRDLARLGFLDPERRAVRRRMMVTSIVLIVAGAVACIAVVPFTARFQAWPALLPLALVLGGIIGVVMAASATPLSDQGLIHAARWRGFKRHLKAIAETRDARAADHVEPRWIVYGIGLGLAYQWAKFLKRHPSAAPAWFTAAAHDDRGAFAAFVGSHGASSGAHGGGGGGGGGAAGGGGSGAG
jgi:hypothetical protein